MECRRGVGDVSRVESPVSDPERSLPSGTVTFLFTDVEGSTRLWAANKDAMSASLLVHDAILRAAIEGNGGVCVHDGRGFVRGGVWSGV